MQQFVNQHAARAAAPSSLPLFTLRLTGLTGHSAPSHGDDQNSLGHAFPATMNGTKESPRPPHLSRLRPQVDNRSSQHLFAKPSLAPSLPPNHFLRPHLFVANSPIRLCEVSQNNLISHPSGSFPPSCKHQDIFSRALSTPLSFPKQRPSSLSSLPFACLFPDSFPCLPSFLRHHESRPKPTPCPSRSTPAWLRMEGRLSRTSEPTSHSPENHLSQDSGLCHAQTR